MHEKCAGNRVRKLHGWWLVLNGAISGVYPFGAGHFGVNPKVTGSLFLLKMRGLTEFAAVIMEGHARNLWPFAALTITFAGLGRAVRGVTTGGALVGAVVCFALLWAAGVGGFAALLTVFVLTWISTRFGYARKQKLGTAEARAGRDAAQVLANLGVAAACALLFVTIPKAGLLVAMGAALAEAAADTVSSEIGQSAGGTPRMITNWRRAAPGTNGAITLLGSGAGVAAACTVALVCRLMGEFGSHAAIISAGAGVAGTIADSFLGATLERRRWLRNNGVNFVSTAIAAVVAIVFSH
jgi:uncharacterized protein (TIGR00297 family)